MSKVIECTLSVDSIGRAIREVEQYRADFLQRIDRLRQIVGERIRWTAEAGFQSAMVSDVIEGPEPVNDVQVTIQHDDSVTIVIAHGEQAVFIEYGAGVWHNGPVGTSPHPWGADNGFLIGQYGKGKGQYDVWRFPGGATFGTPAAMPMYNGWREAVDNIAEMVREVFNT